jgi:hypothetical protein
MDLYHMGCYHLRVMEVSKSKKCVKVIELCSAFGNSEVVRISEAVGKDVIVGVVRFDLENSVKFIKLTGL